MGARILIVDDDPAVRNVVSTLLTRAGHQTFEASDAPAALLVLYAQRPQAVVLDVGLPGMSGWTLLGRIRELSDVPVLMLTAEDTELDKVRGLRAGADDFVTKPFGRQELLARIEALLRRGAGHAEVRDERFDDGVLALDFVQRLAEVDGRELRLTPIEYRLLAAFARHPGQVLSAEQLLDLAWVGEAPGREQVKLNVAALRRKLTDAGAPDGLIETLRGFGYRYRYRRRR